MSSCRPSSTARRHVRSARAPRDVRDRDLERGGRPARCSPGAPSVPPGRARRLGAEARTFDGRASRSAVPRDSAHPEPGRAVGDCVRGSLGVRATRLVPGGTPHPPHVRPRRRALGVHRVTAHASRRTPRSRPPDARAREPHGSPRRRACEHRRAETDRLRDARSWTQRFDLVESFLLRRLDRSGAPEPSLDWAWAHLRRTGGSIPIRALADDLGWSHRRLIVRFREQIGVAPKTFARLVRFDRAVSALQAGRGLAETAFATGYFDQAHMTRDFRELAGTTPASFAAATLESGGIAA